MGSVMLSPDEPAILEFFESETTMANGLKSVF
jgi:hypothetical protein